VFKSLKRKPDFGDWLDMGIAAGWILYPTCSTHDWTPMKQEEMAEFDAGFDPCIPVIRMIEEGENPNDYRLY